MMKKIWMTTIMITLLVLAACGDDATTEEDNLIDEMEEATEDFADEMTDDDVVEEGAEEESTTSGEIAENGDDLNAQLDELSFYDIEIEISYGEAQDFEVSVDRDDDSNRVEAEIEDDVNNVYFEGQDAFDHIYPQLQTLDITPESSQEEVIEQVLNAFDLADDYQEFEIEVYFDDGSKIDYEHRQ